MVDNIFVAQEVIDSMRKKTSWMGFTAIKIDLEKAYDCIEWRFLEMVLQYVGFNHHMS